MGKLSTRWTASPDSYAYHMINKPKIIGAIAELLSGKTLGFKYLSGIILQKEWLMPEEGDFPNYKFVFDLCQAYIAYSKTIEIPTAEGIVYENTVRYLASLAKQDPAYFSRFNGIMFRVLHDYVRGNIKKEGNHKYLKFLVDWWDVFDGRERNHELYKKFLDHIVEKYTEEPFYRKSIDFCLNWIGEHQDEFVYADEMNPKKWYGNCGVGLIDNLTMGGMG